MGKYLTTEEFINKANKIHNYKYDYTDSKYVNNYTKLVIKCKEHGAFEQRPVDHFKGQGCPCCGGNKILNTDEFINRSNKIHEYKYDYSKVKYVNTHTKVCIICKIHGEFYQESKLHMKGFGCPWCSKKKMDTETFIEKSKKVHGDTYDYDKTIYVRNKDKVCITCKKHGYFYQNASHHMNGCGCPICKESNLEKEIRKELEINNLKYIPQYNTNWLGKQSLDFYLPDYNIAIECQGIQHFKPIDYFGGIQRFNKTSKMDKIKKKLCNKNNIKLFYYSNIFEINYIDIIYLDKNKLIEDIFKLKKAE